MRTNLYINISVCILTLLMMWPANFALAVGPGQPNGNLGVNDQSWKAWPGWSVVYDHDDVNTNTWMTGISFWDVYFRYFAGSDFQHDYWIKDITIPWIAMDWNIQGVKRYQHDDFNGGAFTENMLWFGGGPLNGQGIYNGFVDTANQPSSLEAWFEIHFNNDGNPEFQYYEKIELYGSGGLNGWGYIKVLIKEQKHCYCDLNQNGKEDQGESYRWQLPNGQVDRIKTIDLAYMLDADIQNQANNCIHQINGLKQWVRVDTECSGSPDQCDGNGRCVRISDPTHDASMVAINDNHFSSDYYCLRAKGNEYSQAPQSYDNDENLVDQDDQLWYVERFDLINGFPPAGWIGVEFHDFYDPVN